MFGRQIVRLFPPCPRCSTPSSVIGSYCPHKQPSITARLVGSIRPHKSEPLTLTAAHYCPLEMRLTHTHILTQWHTLTHAQVLSLLPSQPSPKGFKYPYVEGWDCLRTHTHTCTPTGCSPVVHGELSARGANKWRRCTQGIELMNRANDKQTRDFHTVNSIS